MDHMVAGVAPATMVAVAGGGARGEVRPRGREGRGKGWGGEPAHPGAVAVAGDTRGATGTTESSRAAAAAVEDGEDARVGFGPPRPDSLRGEGEGLEAVQMEASASSGAAQDGGV